MCRVELDTEGVGVKCGEDEGGYNGARKSAWDTKEKRYLEGMWREGCCRQASPVVEYTRMERTPGMTETTGARSAFRPQRLESYLSG